MSTSRLTVCLLSASMLAFGLLQLTLDASRPGHALAAISAKATPSSTPTPTPSPTPTMPPPAPGPLLTQANTLTLSRHSVLEYGTISSSNNAVLDGRRFWAHYSWDRKAYHDHTFYRRPTDLNVNIRHARDVRRLVLGPWIAVHAHNRWYCLKTKTSANSSYWRPPQFHLTSPVMIGPATVRDHAAWHVRGTFVGQGNHSSSRLTVDAFISRTSHAYLRAVESGTVRAVGRGAASIHGQVDYSTYGKPVKIRVPLTCRSRA